LRAAAVAVAALLFAFTSATASAADILAADKVNAPEALLPYLSWLADPQGEITIRDLGAGTVQERFTPLYKGIPLKNKGPVWFRLLIVNSGQGGVGAVPAQGGARLSMNLGQLPPGGARLFYSESPGPVSAPGVWHSETVNSHEETLLPEAGLAPLAVFIRMEEMPSLWFSPVVGPQSAARAGLLPLDLLLPGITAAAAVACLLRLAADRALWALWAALYLICVLGQSSLPLPSPDRGPAPENLPALLAPGLALLILPHVGRCMFRTDKASVLKDGSLYFCSLLGAVTAMLPLVPGFSWLTRLFPLWPLLLAPALPFCLSSIAAKKPGALAFTGAVVMPVLGALLCLAALKYTDLHPAAAQGGLWGLAVGGLGLALARVPRNSPGPGKGDEDKGELAVPDMPGGLSAAFSVLSPQSQYEELPPMPITRIGGAGDAEPDETARTGNSPEDGRGSGDAPAAGKAGESRTTGERPETARNVSFFLPSGEDRFYPDLPSEVMNILEGPVPTGNVQPGSYPFNLHTLVRQVHDIVSPLAESKGLIFSWYMSPSLPVLLEGDSPRLRGALILLLQSAVQAADGGAVQLAVRRNPMSSFEGDLLFSISDNGSAQRTDAGFFLAWELASRTGGAFTVDYSAAGGTRTAFTVRFKLLGGETSADPVASALPSSSEPESAAPPPRIGGPRSLCLLSAEMTGGARRHIARCLEGVPHNAVNAFDEEQLLRLAGEHEPDLVIFDADMPENVIARCIADLRVDEGAKSRKRAAVLVLTGHDLQAARLLEAGAGYVLGKPFTREAFLDALAAAVPSAASRLRGPGAALAGRSGMFATPAPDLASAVPDTGPAGSPAFAAAEDTARGTPASHPDVAAPHAGAGRDAAVEADAVNRKGIFDDIGATKLPIPARLIPRGMTPDAQPLGESSPETGSAAVPLAGDPSAAAAGSVAAAGSAPAGASEPAPGSAPAAGSASAEAEQPLRAFQARTPGGASDPAPDEAEESDAAKLPRPARLIPRGMAAERTEGGSGREAAHPAGRPAPDAPEDPDSALMPGQRLSRDPFLDPSVAFLRPTFTPPGRPPLREAVKLAMTAGQEASSAVSDAPETSVNPAGRGAGISPTADDAPSPSEQQTQAPPRTGAHIQIQAQPAAAKRASSSAGKGDGASDPARQSPDTDGVDRERAKVSAYAAHHAAERPGAVQVQLPPRHGIPPKGAADAAAAGNAVLKTQQPANAPQGMQISVHPSGSPAGGPPSPRISPAPLIRQARSGQRTDASAAQTGRAQTARIQSVQARAARTGAGQAPAGRVPAAQAGGTTATAAVQAQAARPGAAQAPAGRVPAAQAGGTSAAVTVQAQAARTGADQSPVGRIPAAQAGTTAAATAQARATRAGAGQEPVDRAETARTEAGPVEALRGEEPTPFENALFGIGGEVEPAAIGRAASDAAPMVMGLSPEDVLAPAAAPDRSAESQKRGLPDGADLLDLDAIRTADPAEDGKQTGAARGQEEEKHTSAGSLIDFMLLDAAQDDVDSGAADGTEKTGSPHVAAGKAARDAGAAAGTGRQNPPQAGRSAADKAEREVRATAGPGPRADAARSRAASPAQEAPITNRPASLPVPLAGLDGEFLDPDALPFLPGLADALAGALQDAVKGMAEKRLALVQEAAARMASRAEHFGLNRLGRLARCLERAAEARDEEASRTILEDVRRAAPQYEKALLECFHSFAGVDG
jgi:CheY-like chemotaxis protein